MIRMFVATLSGLFPLLCWAGEVGLITAAKGPLTVQEAKQAAIEVVPFIKIRAQDTIVLKPGAKLQLVYFASARQETWQGPGTLTIGEEASSVAAGNLKPETSTLPAIMVKQLAKTPAADGGVRSGMIRMRSMPSSGTVESLEKNYGEMRRSTQAGDRTPELYLLSGYFDLKEFDKVDAQLKKMLEESPSDQEIKVLQSLYARAMANAKSAQAQ